MTSPRRKKIKWERWVCRNPERFEAKLSRSIMRAGSRLRQDRAASMYPLTGGDVQSAFEFSFNKFFVVKKT